MFLVFHLESFKSLCITLQKNPLESMISKKNTLCNILKNAEKLTQKD